MNQVKTGNSIFLSIILTFFSTFVLLYISMATMIGPWIAPTLVLIAGLVLKLKKYDNFDQKNREISLIQTAGSVGGIVATAVGFTIPTLYFLDRVTFDRLVANLGHFCLLIGAVCLAGGSLGILLGRSFRRKLLVNEQLPHPVSNLIHKTITSQNQKAQTRRMITGLSISWIIGFLRDGFLCIPSLLPAKNIYLFKSMLGCRLNIMISPMLWAIGFIAGLKIAIPLLVGMLSKYFILNPVNNHSLYLPFELFPVLDKKVFGMTFCSGIILAEVIPGILKYPEIIFNSIKQYSGYSYFNLFSSFKNIVKKFFTEPLKKHGFPKQLINLEAIFSMSLIILLFYFLKFSLLSLLIIIPLTIISAYNITFIGCKIGLVQIGRFTTLVMIPTMMIFRLSALQITMLCVLVATCITTTADLIFGYKVGELCNTNDKQIHKYQWLGLIATSVSIGFFLWLLFTNLGVGTEQLFAQRGKARALLIQSFNFNWTVVSLGFCYGLILKKLRVSPSMVFGGVLMPNGLTLALLFGALGGVFVKDKKEHFSFFSGIFAGESIWFILNILMRAI